MNEAVYNLEFLPQEHAATSCLRVVASPQNLTMFAIIKALDSGNKLGQKALKLLLV